MPSGNAGIESRTTNGPRLTFFNIRSHNEWNVDYE